MSELLRLAGLVFIAVSFVVLGDTAGKWLTGHGVDPVFVAWTRFALAAIALAPFSGLTRAELPRLLDWRVLLRSLFIACGICAILTALKTEPIANVFGAFFIGPIVSYVAAALFLGERPTRGRNILLCLGFLGVMLVVKPGPAATSGIGFALLAGLCYGGYLVMTRHIAGRHRPRFLLISQLLIGTVLLTPLGLSAEVPVLTTPITFLLLLSAAGSALGNYMLVIASRRAEASLIAPLVYTQLITATALGIAVFGDWPDIMALSGLILILGSGLGALWLINPKQKYY